MIYKSQFKKITLMTGFVVQGHILEIRDAPILKFWAITEMINTFEI